MSKYGPTRGELKVRLAISLFGLVLMIVALSFHGVPSAPALFEVLGVAGLFFGGSALWSGWKLWKH